MSLADLDVFRTGKSSLQPSAWLWLIVVVVLCRKSFRALAMPVLLETVERGDEISIAHCYEASNAYVDTDVGIGGSTSRSL